MRVEVTNLPRSPVPIKKSLSLPPCSPTFGHFVIVNTTSLSPSMLEPVRPGAASPDRALSLLTFSHFVIVNKLLPPPLSLSDEDDPVAFFWHHNTTHSHIYHDAAGLKSSNASGLKKN